MRLGLIVIIFCLPLLSCVEIDFESPDLEPENDDLNETISYVSVEDLAMVINLGDVDRIVSALNVIKTMPNKHDQLNFIYELWDRKSGDGISDNRVLDNEVVRAEFADVLIQSARNDLIEIDQERLHAQVISHIRSRDPKVRRTAVSALAIFDRCTDVPVIKEMALKENPSTFRSSALTLMQICCAGAGDALDEVERLVKNSENLSFIQELKNSTTQLEVSAALCAE